MSLSRGRVLKLERPFFMEAHCSQVSHKRNEVKD